MGSHTLAVTVLKSGPCSSGISVVSPGKKKDKTLFYGERQRAEYLLCKLWTILFERLHYFLFLSITAHSFQFSTVHFCLVRERT